MNRIDDEGEETPDGYSSEEVELEIGETRVTQRTNRAYVLVPQLRANM